MSHTATYNEKRARKFQRAEGSPSPSRMGWIEVGVCLGVQKDRTSPVIIFPCLHNV